MTQLSDDIVEVYEKLLSQETSAASGEKSSGHVALPLTQTHALQLLFDLKFVNAILPRKDDSKVCLLQGLEISILIPGFTLLI